ncbi:MAG: filamentous hemagglutinin N-terminal domain-containing protein, partial [Fusobacterium gastrosuis]|uniref:two-partner secretion domain-containing protein n=1 Tax=Fusobacterium gastrosuis TaxID=1755100 RepID=UPI002A889520|nr:filamentous hemagglutinin N-terminal domain-containing protein [Fusobacterium gastrosuis]
MNQLRKVEKILKGCLKDRRRVTLALLVSFLINGGLSYASENIKVSSDQKNEIIIDKDESNNNIHINIVAPNNDGVSHNKYEKFSIEKDEKVIFNNNTERNKESTLDPEYKAVNEGLTGRDKKAADLIISEVVGNEKSKFEGELEVYGKEADLIFANENGIDINGQKFINAGDVAFVTQKGLDSWDKDTLKNNDFSTNDKVNIERGTITVGEQGIKLSDDKENKLRLIAEKIEVKNIGKAEDKINIELHSGKNKNKTSSNNGGIKLTGSMYGNNIIIRNYSGSNGIELAGSIEAKEQVDIDSKTGKITVKNRVEAKKINVTAAGGQKNSNIENKKNSPLLDIEKDGNLYGHEQVEIIAKSAEDIQSKGKISAIGEIDEEDNTKGKKVIFKFKDSGTLNNEELPKDYTFENKNNEEKKNTDNSSLKNLLSTVKAGDKIDVIFNYANESQSKKYTLKKKADKGESEKSEKELEKERKEREEKEKEKEKEKRLKEEEEKKRKEAELKEKEEKEKREKEEAERKLKEEELKKKQKEAEELAKKKAKEEEERKAEQERLEKQKELEKKQKEEELAKKKAKEEKDRYNQLNSTNIVIDSSKGSDNSTKLKITEEEMKLREKGTVVVDISQANKDNKDKISHNYYTKFTIPKKNNVLLNNNSTDNKVKSELEKYEVGKNENLKNGSAGLIINEVNNSNNSEITELAGGLEVLGEKADVVVANENGILVNGGKFVNTNRLALSTGKFSKKGEKELEFGARK